jgi:hypothetical protein
VTHFRSLIVCFLSVVLASYAMQAPALKPITKRGLLDALKIGGLTTSELVRKLKERGVNFAITPDVEDELRKAGASSEVIQAARDNYHGVPLMTSKPPVTVVENISEPVVRTPIQPPKRTSTSRPGIYYRRGDQWVELLSEVVNWKKGSMLHKIPKFGVGKGKITGAIPGAHSPNSYRNPLRFLVVTPVGIPIDEYVLTRLHDKHEDREFEIDASRTGGRDLLPFSSKKTAERIFQIDVTQDAGEYGFLMAAAEGADSQYGKMYTFRVLE